MIETNGLEEISVCYTTEGSAPEKNEIRILRIVMSRLIEWYGGVWADDGGVWADDGRVWADDGGVWADDGGVWAEWLSVIWGIGARWSACWVSIGMTFYFILSYKFRFEKKAEEQKREIKEQILNRSK